MSTRDDWMEIRTRGANCWEIIKDEEPFAIGEGLMLEFGSFGGVPTNGIQLICPEDTGGQVKFLVRVQLKIVQDFLKKYPATLPIYSIRATWPHPVPMPAATTQEPPPPPIIIPPLPPTTPPTTNDRIYYV